MKSWFLEILIQNESNEEYVIKSIEKTTESLKIYLKKYF